MYPVYSLALFGPVPAGVLSYPRPLALYRGYSLALALYPGVLLGALSHVPRGTRSNSPLSSSKSVRPLEVSRGNPDYRNPIRHLSYRMKEPN